MSPYERLGGARAVHALTHHFYDLIDREPLYAELRALHAGGTDQVRPAFEAWLTAWLGGPVALSTPHGCIMGRHRAMGFGTLPAAQWIAAMDAALVEHVGDDDLRTAMRARFLQMARGMIVRPDA